MIYRFDEFEIDEEGFQIRIGAGELPSEPQTLEFLLYMIRNWDRLVTKDELHAVFWDGRFVSEAALSTLVRSARRVLGDAGREQRYIQTEYGRGFRFIADVREAPKPVGRDAVPALAVLRFANLSGAPANDVIADGLTQEITTALTRTRHLMIVSSGSALTIREKAPDPGRTATALGVDYLLEGSLNRDGDSIWVHAHLVDPASGTRLWALRHDFKFQSLFDLLDKITDRVVGV